MRNKGGEKEVDMALVRPARKTISLQNGITLEVDDTGKYHLEVGNRHGLTIEELSNVAEQLVLFFICKGAGR